MRPCVQSPFCSETDENSPSPLIFWRKMQLRGGGGHSKPVRFCPAERIISQSFFSTPLCTRSQGHRSGEAQTGAEFEGQLILLQGHRCNHPLFFSPAAHPVRFWNTFSHYHSLSCAVYLVDIVQVILNIIWFITLPTWNCVPPPQHCHLMYSGVCCLLSFVIVHGFFSFISLPA